MNLYKRCMTKPCSVLLTDASLASDNPLLFGKTFLEKGYQN